MPLLLHNSPIDKKEINVIVKNNLAEANSDVASFWDYTHNILKPEEVTPGSRKEVWWLCEKGHSYLMAIKKRTAGRGCSYCAGKKVLTGFNDLATKDPNLAKQWHPSKNGDLTPEQIMAGSSQLVWWQCEKGHEWEISPNYRKSKNCPYCSGRRVIIGYNDFAKSFPKIAKEWHPSKNSTLEPIDKTVGSRYKAWWLCEKGHEWQARIGERTGHKTNCPVCALGKQTSKAEKEIASHLINQGISIETSNRSLLNGKEIDIFIPDKNIAIEFNGLFWHSEEAGKGKDYHYNKWNSLQEQGIQLLQIWEDDWTANKKKVLAFIDHKLGISQQQTIFARKTKVEKLTVKDARNFLEENHLQGFVNGSMYIGLYNRKNELCACMVLQKQKDRTYIIARYATSAKVVGGFTKLLAYSTKELDVSKFVTFSDNCVSDGSLYKNHGFIRDKELKPDYMYVEKDKRKHKFGYRISKFRSREDLDYIESLSETELAKLNNLPRIWDAGKIRWIKEV